MYKCNYPNLFSPIQLGGTVFRNRIFAAPTGVFYADPAHRPNIETMAYYERKARGGAGCVCVGDAMVDREHGVHGAYAMLMEDPGLMPVLNKLSSQISRHGAVATLEMFHAGSASSVSYHDGHEIYGPQDERVEGALGQPPVLVKALTRSYMDAIVKQHVDGAMKAKSCGFGMVTLHAAHGFLMHQFMSPTLNHRTDEYGGSFENRMRFPLEIVKAVRCAVGPDFPLELRISGSEVYEGGYGIEYGCRIAQAFDGIVDLIHVSAGSHEDARVFTVTHPSMFLEDGVNVKYAAAIKKVVKFSKVAAVGALSDPAQLEEILASGQADVVELARGLICDPDLPLKAREGRAVEIIRCMRCFTCFSSLLVHGQIVCALNPEISDESEQKYARPPAAKKKVLVAGGGISGMEAAVTCAKRGHEVILCEKTDALGGVLLCEKNVPFKKHLHEYLDLMANRVLTENIDLRLNTEVTPELAKSLGPDVLIAALGAVPLVPDIPGIHGDFVLGAAEVYRSPAKAGQTVVILGGGLVGSELAIYLAGLGREVTLLEMLPRLNTGDNILHAQAIALELSRLGVRLALNTKAVEISEKGVLGNDGQQTRLFDADTVVCALGLQPLREQADRLRFCAPVFHQLGDCLDPKTIYDANRTARQIALDVGAF